MITYTDGGQYNGLWEKGYKQGLGVYRYPCGEYIRRYSGEFERNLYQGNGVLELQNGYRYIGTFKRGQKHGYGRYEDQEQNVVKEGEWYEGEYSAELKSKEDLKKLDKLISKILKVEPRMFRDFNLD